LSPIKINTVVVRGQNEEDVVDLAGLTRQHPWQVRFIEMMPFRGPTNLQIGQLVSTQEIKDRVQNAFGPLTIVNGGEFDGEAQIYRFQGSIGDVGFISSVSAPFCDNCTRARLTSDGILRMCLLREYEIDLLTPLRAGAPIENLRQMILDAVWNKPWGHGLATGEIPLNRGMSQIGG
jgi:cyclic pyranopterin phosphate synthase